MLSHCHYEGCRRIVGAFALFLLCCLPADSQSQPAGIKALTTPSGNLAITYEYELERGQTTPTSSITAKEPNYVLLKDKQTIKVEGKLYLDGETVWTKEAKVGEGIQRVDAIWKGRFVSFTVDSKNQMKVVPTGILFQEGHGGFFAGEILNRSLFGDGPVGKGYSWREILQGYADTGTTVQGDKRTYKAVGPKPYVASITTNLSGDTLTSIQFKSTEPSFQFERTTSFGDWKEVSGIKLPMTATHVFSEKIPDASGQGPGTVVKVRFKVTGVKPGAKPVPFTDGMIFYEIDKESGAKTAYRFDGGEFTRTEDPGLVYKSESEPPVIPIVITGVVVLGIGLLVWRRRRILKSKSLA